MSITGEEGGVPVKVGVSIADLTAALYATIATLAALRARERDGKGQLVDISMFESAVSLAVWEAGVFFGSGEVPHAAGSAHKLVAPYQAVAASDRHFIVGATTPPNWTAFCRVLGLGALETDPRYATANARRRNRPALVAAIEQVTRTKPAAHWLGLLREAGVPCGEIADYRDVFDDPHLVARKLCVDLEHPVLGTLRGRGAPFGAGADVGQFVDFKEAGQALAYEHRMDDWLGAIEDVRVPTIAALRGPVVGGGLAIAAACDLRVAAPSARFGVPVARTLGNCFSAANLVRLAALVGLGRVKELVLTARLIDAQEARAIGLVSEVVAGEEALEPRVGELVAELMSYAPLTLHATKEMVRRIRSRMMPDEASDLVALCYTSADFREGVAAFLERRKPVWKGR